MSCHKSFAYICGCQTFFVAYYTTRAITKYEADGMARQRGWKKRGGNWVCKDCA